MHVTYEVSQVKNGGTHPGLQLDICSRDLRKRFLKQQMAVLLHWRGGRVESLHLDASKLYPARAWPLR